MALATPIQKPQGPAESQAQKSWTQIFIRRFKKNRLAVFGLILLSLMVFMAVFAKFLAPADPAAMDLTMRLKPPGTVNPTTGFRYILGTDTYGRDMLSRIIWGSQISLYVGVLSTVVSLTIGTLVGSVAGFYGGWVDAVLMRLVDILLSIPTLPLLLFVLAVIGNSITLIIGTLAATSWMVTARLVRGEILSIRQRDFVEAARAMGAKDARIMFKHILPNLFHILMVSATLRVASTMLTEASLSFLGIGVQPPTPSWGNILYEHITYMRQAFWTQFWPGLAIFLTALSIYFLGDGLRDALDPRMKD
jgi:peptide/nickel transport system permease protein